MNQCKLPCHVVISPLRSPTASNHMDPTCRGVYRLSALRNVIKQKEVKISCLTGPETSARVWHPTVHRVALQLCCLSPCFVAVTQRSPLLMAGEMAAIRKELIAEKVRGTTLRHTSIACFIPPSSPNSRVLSGLTHCIYRQKNRVTLTAQLVETKKKLEQSEVLLCMCFLNTVESANGGSLAVSDFLWEVNSMARVLLRSWTSKLNTQQALIDQKQT